jgi:hypothetical protein
MLTRLFLLKPPEGVSPAEFDQWYLHVHANEARMIESIARYVSWRAERIPPELTAPAFDRFNNWYRLTEVGTRGVGGAVGGGATPRYTPPPYEARADSWLGWWHEETIVVPDQPQYDLLREVPEVSG